MPPFLSTSECKQRRDGWERVVQSPDSIHPSIPPTEAETETGTPPLEQGFGMGENVCPPPFFPSLFCLLPPTRLQLRVQTTTHGQSKRTVPLSIARDCLGGERERVSRSSLGTTTTNARCYCSRVMCIYVYILLTRT